MKVEPTEIKKKSIKKVISEYKLFIIAGVGIVIVFFLLFVFGSSVCETITFQYENQIVPAKVCLNKYMNYEADGAKKNVEFTASFIKNLVISYGGK